MTVFDVIFSNVLTTFYQKFIKKACDQDLTHSLDTLKSFSVKIVPQVVTRDAHGT